MHIDQSLMTILPLAYPTFSRIWSHYKRDLLHIISFMVAGGTTSRSLPLFVFLCCTPIHRSVNTFEVYINTDLFLIVNASHRKQITLNQHNAVEYLSLFLLTLVIECIYPDFSRIFGDRFTCSQKNNSPETRTVSQSLPFGLCSATLFEQLFSHFLLLQFNARLTLSIVFVNTLLNLVKVWPNNC